MALKPFERLPKAIQPVHYEISIKPNLFSLVFQGTETVTFQVVEPVDEIRLNSLELQLSDVNVVSESCDDIPVQQVVMDTANEQAVIHLSSTLHQGTFYLKLSFHGNVVDKPNGLYFNKYINAQGEEQFNAVTQFEPTFARRVFPCWDEPALRATFDIELIVPKSHVALSNMPVVSKSPYEGDEQLCVIKFDCTPTMPTYLVGFAVGEFDYVEARSADGVLCRVYTPVGKSQQGKFSLDFTVKALPYYKQYFDIEYPLPKMDLIAVASHSSGAMENWGMMTFRESLLLVDEENTSTQRRQFVAEIVGHELAHQWFGNLVTLKWWTHLWLKEGYATFVQALCVDHLFPEYKIWMQFVTDMWSTAIELDSLKNSHAIEVPVSHPNEIDEIFDDISYNKGASVLRMLHNYIGDNDFRRGMKHYLDRHKYGSTTTEDLWVALGEASSDNKPIGRIMSGWTKQTGFPVISVSARTVDGKRMVRLRQKRFLADGCEDPANTKWVVPIEFVTQRTPDKVVHSFVLNSAQTEFILDNLRPDEWFKINPSQIGFYRTCYDNDLLKQLVVAVGQQSLPPLDRLGLIDDLFALAKSGHASTVQVLELLEAFVDEEEYTVWEKICQVLGNLSQLVLDQTELHGQIKSFSRQLLCGIVGRLGWQSKPDEDHSTKMLRSLVLEQMAALDDINVLAESERRFDALLNQGQAIDSDLRLPVYKGVLRASNPVTRFESLKRLYCEATLQEEKVRVANALGLLKDESLLFSALDFAVSPEVLAQHTLNIVSSVALGSSTGRQLAWDFFCQRWAEFSERFQGAFLLARIVKTLTKNFATEQKAVEVDTFFEEHKCAGTERTVQQSIESIRLNVAWLKRDASSIKCFLSKK